MNKWSKLVISAVVAGFVSHAAFANEEPAATDAATGEAPKAEAGKNGCGGKGGCKGHKKGAKKAEKAGKHNKNEKKEEAK